MSFRTKCKQSAVPVIAAAAVSVLGAATPAHVLTITYTDNGSVGAAMMTGFNAAATILQDLLTDNVNVNIGVSTSSGMSSHVIASTSTARVSYSYATVRSALVANSTSGVDASSVAHLQAGPSVNMVTNNDGTATRVFDNNGSTNNSNILMTTANAKALGLYADAGLADAAVTFNANFAYDFDRSNGISGYDFIGIALHELVTALGFVSGVDTIDSWTQLGIPTDGMAVLSTLDLFRFSSDSLSHGADVIDASVGGTPFFSVDGGATNESDFSTGSHNGNGFQASRWALNSGGVMQPTAPYGQQIDFLQKDTDALDVVGWEITPNTHTNTNTPPPPPEDPPANIQINTPTVPEPGSLMLFGLGLGALALARRRRRS